MKEGERPLSIFTAGGEGGREGGKHIGGIVKIALNGTFTFVRTPADTKCYNTH